MTESRVKLGSGDVQSMDYMLGFVTKDESSPDEGDEATILYSGVLYSLFRPGEKMVVTAKRPDRLIVDVKTRAALGQVPMEYRRVGTVEIFTVYGEQVVTGPCEGQP
jgi:hypothetical protein